MAVKLPILYSQFDPLWSSEPLGNNTDPEYSIYNYGCLISCLAMVCQYYKKSENPSTLNQELKIKGGFGEGNGLYVHGKLTELYPDITETFTPTPNRLTDEQVKTIKDSLDSGTPVVLGLDYNPRTIAAENHFVVAIAYDPNDENNLTIADPLGGRLHSIKDYLGWLKPSIRDTIESYFTYRGGSSATDITVASFPSPAIADTPSSALPANYADIIHNSTEWEKVTTYLELDKEARYASFEDCKKVIAGLKSAKTDYYNKMIQAQKEAGESVVTITNQTEDISRLKDALLQTQKLNKAEFDNLKLNTPNTENLKRQYEAVLEEVNKTLDTKIDEIKTLRVEIAHNKVMLENSGAQLMTEIKNTGSILHRLLGLKI